MITGGKGKFALIEQTYTNKPGLSFFSYHIPISKQSKNKIRKDASKKIIQERVINLGEDRKKYFDGNLEIELNFGMDAGRKETKTTDIDNLVKHTLDCLKGVLFKDDKQIRALHAYKHIVDKGTSDCTGIRIRKLE